MIPTEAQWEHAIRSNTTSAWSYGPDLESIRGCVNIADQTAIRAGAAWQQEQRDWPDYDDGHVVHAAVDFFPANPWGFFGAHGNVFEWCKDSYGEYHFPTLPGTGERDIPARAEKVMRDGCFDSSVYITRTTYRSPRPETLRARGIGIRPARLIDGS